MNRKEKRRKRRGKGEGFKRREDQGKESNCFNKESENKYLKSSLEVERFKMAEADFESVNTETAYVMLMLDDAKFQRGNRIK